MGCAPRDGSGMPAGYPPYNTWALVKKPISGSAIVFTPDQLEALVRLFGVDKILLGTDYPYDMGEYDPIGHIASVASFSEADRAAIAGGNAKALFGL